MKKIVSATLSLALCLALGNTAFADGEPYETAGDLYQSWYDSELALHPEDMDPRPYPDYVAGVWTPDGSGITLTFALVEGAGEAEKEEILSQVRDKSTVQFAEGFRYSIAELQAVMDDFGTRGDLRDAGVSGWGIAERDNLLIVGIADPSVPAAQALMEDCRKKYGERIAFEQEGYATPAAESSEYRASGEVPAVEAAARRSLDSLYWLLIIAALSALAFVFLRRRNTAAQTPEGVTVGVSHPTARQVEDAVASKTQAPPEALHRAVEDKLGLPRA